jgi:hypothetical protein
MKKPGKKGNQRKPLTSQGFPLKTGKQANMGNFTLFFIPLRNPQKKHTFIAHPYTTLLLSKSMGRPHKKAHF